MHHCNRHREAVGEAVSRNFGQCLLRSAPKETSLRGCWRSSLTKISTMSEKKYRWFKIFSSEEEMKNNVAFRKTHSLTVDGKKICLVHGLDGFYAVRDKCPHNGFPLSAGSCSDVNSIVCPVHRYHFDLKNR